MRRIIFPIILLPLLAVAQIDIKAKRLQDYINIDNTIVHTTVISVTNRDDYPVMVYLRNNPAITGTTLKDWGWKEPVQFLGESTSSMIIDYKTCLPGIFGTWFKNIEPWETFMFYFQSTSDIKPEDLKALVVTRKAFTNDSSQKLSWKDNEIIISLCPK